MYVSCEVLVFSNLDAALNQCICHSLTLVLGLFVLSESDYWLRVLFTTKDDEQAARHLGFVFVG